MSIKSCRCGAKWRYTHPFGKKSKARKILIKPHNRDCKFGKKD